MAITKTENQVTWSASNSVSVSTGGTQTSDVVTLDDTCMLATIHMKADNSTTPASDDQLYVWVLQTGGDPDGASTDEYDSTSGARLLAILDTNDQDPYLTSADLPVTNDSLKIYVEGSTAGTTNSITFSCTITEHRVA